MRKLYLVTSALMLCTSRLLPAQDAPSATDLARLALQAAIQRATVNDITPRTKLIDAAAFSDRLNNGAGPIISVDSLLAIAGPGSAVSDWAKARTCIDGPDGRSCRLRDNGLFFTLDSAAVGVGIAELYVRYVYPTTLGPRKLPYIGFVQLRIKLEQEGAAWKVVDVQNAMRS